MPRRASTRRPCGSEARAGRREPAVLRVGRERLGDDGHERPRPRGLVRRARSRRRVTRTRSPAGSSPSFDSRLPASASHRRTPALNTSARPSRASPAWTSGATYGSDDASLRASGARRVTEWSKRPTPSTPKRTVAGDISPCASFIGCWLASRRPWSAPTPVSTSRRMRSAISSGSHSRESQSSEAARRRGNRRRRRGRRPGPRPRARARGSGWRASRCAAPRAGSRRGERLPRGKRRRSTRRRRAEWPRPRAPNAARRRGESGARRAHRRLRRVRTVPSIGSRD